MAYENSGNNTQKKSVNTGGQRYVNGHMVVPCALTVAYWDDMVKLSFAKELPKEQITQMRRYDYEHSVVSCLTRVKSNMLVKHFHEKFLPALQANEEFAISVSVGVVNQIQLATNIIEGVAHPVIRLIKDMNEQTLIPTDVVEYEFNTTEIIYGYNPKTGSFTDRVYDYGELLLFIHDLESSVEASSNAYVHTDRVVQRYMNDKVDNKLNQIGTKLGLNLDTRPQYAAGGYGGQGSIFENRSSYSNNNSSTFTVETSNVGSIDQLNELIPTE